MKVFHHRNERGETVYHVGSIIVACIICIIVISAASMIINPIYGVWSKTLSGKAELQKQEFERKVKIVQSEADLEASKNQAQAEVNRAEGAAKAATIISGALENNPHYLTYLAIQAQAENAKGENHTTIYIPVGDNGIPLVQNVGK